jgi:hypothetical protein
MEAGAAPPHPKGPEGHHRQQAALRLCNPFQMSFHSESSVPPLQRGPTPLGQMARILQGKWQLAPDWRCFGASSTAPPQRGISVGLCRVLVCYLLCSWREIDCAVLLVFVSSSATIVGLPVTHSGPKNTQRSRMLLGTPLTWI